MFEDDKWATQRAEEILELFDLVDIFEMNDLTDIEVLAYLIGNGHISQPERLLGPSEDESQEES